MQVKKSTTTDNPLLLSAVETAALLGIARSHLYALHSSGRLPIPIKLGRRSLWRKNELEAWVQAGCPARSRWAAMKGISHE